MSVKISCAKWLLVTVWMRLGTWELSIATWTAEMCSLQRVRRDRTAVFGSVFTQSENEKFPENTMFFFAVLNMEVSRCCLPWSVQCHAGDNPQGFTLYVCVWVCVQRCLSRPLMYIFVLFAFGFPSAVLFILEQHVSQVLSEDSSERGRERDAGTPRKSKRETEKRGGRQGKKSFERLLTSKLTVIAVLARGESTFKHTGWVTMWRDYKSKVIHNKQRSLCSAPLPANLHEIGVERKFGSAWKVSKGLM